MSPFVYDERFNQLQQDGKTIVLLWGKSATPEHKVLIEAAPDLLEALQGAMNTLEHYSDRIHPSVIISARNAIKKATKKP